MSSKDMEARNKTIALLALYDHMNLRQIGESLGLSRESVRRILVQQEINYKVVLERRRRLGLASQATVAGVRVNPVTIIQHGPHKGKKQPEYVVYTAMLDRCFSSQHPRFPDYGGRGVTVCDRWRGEDGYENFLLDMGKRPPGVSSRGRAKYSIHRVDNDGPYEPGNCKWATQKEQCANKRPPVRRVKLKPTPASTDVCYRLRRNRHQIGQCTAGTCIEAEART